MFAGTLISSQSSDSHPRGISARNVGHTEERREAGGERTLHVEQMHAERFIRRQTGVYTFSCAMHVSNSHMFNGGTIDQCAASKPSRRRYSVGDFPTWMCSVVCACNG